MKQDDEHLRGHVRRRQYLSWRSDTGEDSDPLARLRTRRILQFSILVGGGAGFVFGLRFGHPVLGGLAGAAIVTGFVFMVVEGGGHVASRIYHPSGSSTPHKRDYSLAASLAIRGQYAEAAEAYEIAISEFPDDPEPYLRLARLLRDEMDRPEDAVIWFKRARADARISDGQRMLASRELVELYTVKLDQPAKAAPELARLAEKYAGRPEGEWAKNELADVKRRMAEDREG